MNHRLLSAFHGAAAYGRPTGGIVARILFLKELVAADRSVASMMATDLPVGSKPAKMGANRWWLIARNFDKSRRSRNRCNILASGKVRWLRKWAKPLHERFSASSWTSKLNECTGVTKLSKSTRNN
jgi:hypothetical protein